MCGGKGSQSGGGAGALGWGGLAPAQQQTTQASPQALGWYQQAMGLGQQAVSNPYQQFGTTPQDFVAQLNAQQQAAQQGIQQQAAATQPYAQMGAGMQAASGMGNAAQMAGAYMNPFMQQVVSPVQQALQQQQGQQLAQQQADAIRGGAFGGERAGLQRAVLQGQQELGMGQALSPLYQTGYGQALGAAQTDLQRQLAAGQGLTQAGLAAQQASLGAGTLGQQTQQAGINALYNQFQQQQMWPYMQAQFLGGLAGSLGPLTGTQTYQAQASNPFGMLMARGGAANSRMGGAVRDGGDYYKGGVVPQGYATKGGVPIGDVSYGDDHDLASALASQEAMYQNAPTPEDMPTGQIQTGKPLEAKLGSAGQGKQGTSLSDIISAGEKALGLGSDLYGMGKSAYSGLSSGVDWLGKNMNLGQAAGVNPFPQSYSSAMYGAGTGQAELPQAYEAASGLASDAGAAAADTGMLSGIGSAIMDFLPFLAFKNGGVVPRHGYNGENGSSVPVSDDDDGFEPAVERTLKFEGGLNPRDTTGMPSMYGISQKAHPGMDVTKITPEQAKDIYRKEYWDGIGASNLDPNIREMAYDTSVIAGPGRAKQLLAQSENDPEKFMAARRDFLNSLVERNPEKYGKYAKAWENRNRALEGGDTAGGGLAGAEKALLSSRSEIPLGDPRRSYLGLDQSEKAAPEEEGLGGIFKEEHVVPALMGLGSAISGMVGAKTTSPGAAIASGLGQGLAGGAKSYMDMRKDQLAREIEKAKMSLQERGVNVEELNALLKQAEFTQKQRSIKNTADILAGRKPSYPETPTTTTPKDTTPSGQTPQLMEQKAEAIRLAERAEAEAEQYRQMARAATTQEEQRDFLSKANASDARAENLRMQSPENLELKAGTELRAKQYQTVEQNIAEDVAASEDAIKRLELTKNVLDDKGVYTGPLGERFLQFKQALDALGYPGLKEGIANTEFFRSMANKMVLDATKGSLGAGVSNSDVAFLQRAQANMGTSKEGNKKIIDMAIKLQKRKQEIADFQDKYGNVDRKFAISLKNWAKEHPMFSENDIPLKSETKPSSDAAFKALKEKYPQYSEDELRAQYELLKKGRK
jgi:Glycosyl hydrolase 108